jgi:hypothetical protein
LSFGGAVPAEYGTCWAPPDRIEIPVVPAATAAIATPLSKVRRAIMWSSRYGAVSRGTRFYYNPKAMPVYRPAGRAFRSR